MFFQNDKVPQQDLKFMSKRQSFCLYVAIDEALLFLLNFWTVDVWVRPMYWQPVHEVTKYYQSVGPGA